MPSNDSDDEDGVPEFFRRDKNYILEEESIQSSELDIEIKICKLIEKFWFERNSEMLIALKNLLEVESQVQEILDLVLLLLDGEHMSVLNAFKTTYSIEVLMGLTCEDQDFPEFIAQHIYSSLSNSQHKNYLALKFLVLGTAYSVNII